MSLLSANDLSLSYGNHVLLESVTLSISPGEKVGLVGRNGSGKTSLLKILSGVEQADRGTLSTKRGLRIGYLPQDFDLDPELNVGENIRQGASDLIDALNRYEAGQGTESQLADLLHLIEAADGWNLDARVKSLATSLGAPPLEASVVSLSGGEKRRIALCRALVSQPDLILLDEPTNHLDAESIRWLESFLSTFPGAVLFITHDRYFLDTIATSIIELAHGKAYTHPGNYTAYLESKAIRQEIAEQSERRRQRFLRVELDWVRAGVKARTTKSKHRLESYYQIADQSAPPEERELDLLLPPPPQLGDLIIELENAGISFPVPELNAADRWLFRHLNLSIKEGQCTGIVGPNGAGKTTLLKLCLGELPPTEGQATLGKRVKVNYIDQNRMQLTPGASVIQEVADQGDTVFFGEQKINVRSWLKRFLFTDDRINERVDNLSGGEKARLMLAKVLKRGGNLIILDEPTNDLDLPSLRMLEEALASFGGSVIVVSHDRYFLDRVCDQIVAFEPSGVHVNPGNYSYYLEKRAERERKDREFIQSFKPAPATSSAPKRQERPRKLSFKEKKELETMESTILEAETRVEEISRTLNDPQFYVNHSDQAQSLISESEALQFKINSLYERWQELEKIAESS